MIQRTFRSLGRQVCKRLIELPHGIEPRSLRASWAKERWAIDLYCVRTGWSSCDVLAKMILSFSPESFRLHNRVDMSLAAENGFEDISMIRIGSLGKVKEPFLLSDGDGLVLTRRIRNELSSLSLKQQLTTTDKSTAEWSGGADDPRNEGEM